MPSLTPSQARPPVSLGRIASLALALLVPGGTACNADNTPYVNYHTGKDLTPCGNTVTYLNNFVPFLADQLGLDVTGQIDYYWMNGTEYGENRCPGSTVGCQINDQIYARNPSLLHELVHAVTEQAGMNNLDFFTEGIAVAYDPWYGGGAGPRFMFKPKPGEAVSDPRESMTLSAGEISYNQADSFVTFLLLRHGAEKFVAMTQLLKSDSTYPQISQTFRRIYGVELDDEVEVFIANDYCSGETGDLYLYDCVAPPIERSDAGWSWRASMDCASEDVAGGFGDPDMDLRSQRSVSLDIQTPGLYELTTRSSGDVAFKTTLGRCFGCPWHPRDTVVQNGETLTVELSAGRHFLRVTAAAKEVPSFEISLLAQ